MGSFVITARESSRAGCRLTESQSRAERVTRDSITSRALFSNQIVEITDRT